VFKDLTTGITDASVAGVRYFGNVFQNCTNDFGSSPTVTAAATINAPPGLTYIPIDGNTNIDTINLGYDGRIIVLRFSGTPTVSDMGGNCDLAGAFTASNLDTLTLVYSTASARWFEISRSLN